MEEKEQRNVQVVTVWELEVTSKITGVGEVIISGQSDFENRKKILKIISSIFDPFTS